MRHSFQPSEREHQKKVEKHVQAQIFDVYSRVLLEAPFVTSVKSITDKTWSLRESLVIARDSEKFVLSVMFSHWSKTCKIVVMHKTPQNQDALFFRPYFTQRFDLKKLGKVRRSALILRKKLEMFDIHLVLSS
jgi:hypothetical protein